MENQEKNGMIAELLDGSFIFSKENCEKLCAKLVQPVLDGDVNPLAVLGLITSYDKALKTARELIMEEALKEADKYESKSFRFMGADFQVKETGVKYDFSGDKDWRDFNMILEEVKAEMKGREEILKRLKLAPKTSTTTVVVTLK